MTHPLARLDSRRVGRSIAGSLLLALIASAAAAQTHVPVDTLTGRVIAGDSTPIPQARVRITPDTGGERSVLSDSMGRYFLTMARGPATYVISAAAFGYLPLSVVVEREPGATRLTRDLRLSPQPIMLKALTVVAPRPSQDKAAPGEKGARWSSVASEAFVTDPGDFSSVALLQPGVHRSGPGAAGLSIAGQSGEQNGATLDGATFSGAGIPSEAVRSIAVIGSSYDVSRGQFSGGQIAATTLSGTNRWGGSLSTNIDPPALSYGGASHALSGAPLGRFRLSSGGGGAPLRDRLFVYGALDLAQSGTAAAGLELLDSAAARQVGIAPDSVRRMSDIAQRLGLARTDPATAPATQSRSSSALARLDYSLTSGQSLTLRLDARHSDLDGFGASPLRLLGPPSTLRSRSQGILLQHAAARGRWANELRLYRSTSRFGNAPESAIPSGAVRVRSSLEDGTTGWSELSFGGLAFGERQTRSLWEITEEVKVALASGHEIKLGVLLQGERATDANNAAQLGSFLFHSLDDLENNRPASFTRLLSEGVAEAERHAVAFYIGDRWTANERLGLVYGVRVDGTHYGSRSALAPSLYSLGVSERSAPPADLAISPRVGLRYDLPGRGHWILDGGIGGFSGTSALTSLASRWNATGYGERQLVCLGVAAPTPAWRRYGSDADAIPSTCADGAAHFASAAPTATLFGADFASPRTSRASLGASGMLIGRWGISLDAIVAHGTHLRSAFDRNLARTAVFPLLEEHARPVYVAPEAIDPASGAISPRASRVRSDHGSVIELRSEGKSWTEQITVGMGGFVGRSGRLDLTYSHTRSRALSGGIPAPGVSSFDSDGDPHRLEWAPTAYTPRHVFQAILSGDIGSLLQVSAIGGLSSGMPFTPLVDGDINGDGYRNDRAFVFAPDQVTDPTLAREMERLRQTARGGVRKCLRSEAGRIAAIGACQGPATVSLDVRLALKALERWSDRRLHITVAASNVPAGLDYLLHGSKGLRGWGQAPIPDAMLLQVRGFDAGRRAFEYSVNPAFGRAMDADAYRLPFSLSLQGRITVGADPRYQPLVQAVQLHAGSSREAARAAFTKRIRNIPSAVLQLDASDTTVLALSAIQRVRLQELGDSLDREIAAVADSLADAYTQVGPITGPRQARMIQAAQDADALATLNLERTRALLTSAQWERLPRWLTQVVPVDVLQKPPVLHTELPMGALE